MTPSQPTHARASTRRPTGRRRTIGAATSKKASSNGALPEDALKTAIVSTLERQGALKVRAIALAVSADAHAVKFALKRLAAGGLVHSQGATAGQTWALATKGATPAPAKAAPTVLVAPENSALEEAQRTARRRNHDLGPFRALNGQHIARCKGCDTFISIRGDKVEGPGTRLDCTYTPAFES